MSPGESEREVQAQRMEALGRLTVGLAYDLNDHVLVPILMLSKKLLGSSRSCSERKEIILIQQNGERVRDMVHALLLLLTDGAEGHTDRALNKVDMDTLAEWHRLLSRRERDVLRGVTRGLSNKEIARELGVVEATVKLHLRGAFQKIGARGRADAAAKYTKAGFA